MTLVHVQSVSHVVLRDVTLSLPSSRLAVLAGRSGSGKSTLCHLMAGVMRPSSGSVSIAGHAAFPRPDWATVSLLPQRLALEPSLSVAENVLLPAALHSSSSGLPLLDQLGLAAIASRPAGDTSLGEQQRTALARALVLAPAVAVLDEPTAHQDDEHVSLVLDAMRTAVEGGTLVVVATHDQRVIDIADTVIRLASGRVQHVP